mgnify:CR=1 FL=1
MISHESPSELIAAEIEAIIQEEINSQASPELVEEDVIVTSQNISEDVEVSDNLIQVQEVDEPAEENATEENLNVVVSTEDNSEKDTELPEKDNFIDYTVNIGSPSQELVSISEVQESLVTVPLVESFLKDAPVDENDGPRAKHLKQALRKALNNTIKSCR